MEEQAFNSKTKTWVKYTVTRSKKGKKRISGLNVKQREPSKPFKGVKKHK